MFFRLTYAVRGYQLQYQDAIRIHIGGPHANVAVLRHEPGEGSAYGEVVLEVTGDFEPPRKSAEALRDLVRGLLPADSRPEADLASLVSERQLPESGRGLRFGELPNRLRDFIREVTRELANTATQAFELIRWRRAMEGPVEALWSREFEGIEWRDDSGNWRTLPADFQLGGRVLVLPRSTPEEVSDLEAMAASGMSEPLGHALLRQAQRASTQREYASALVMAIAALEIRVKQLIGTLVPGAEWLALHVPSPPIVDVLTDYLPSLPSHESIGGYVSRPPGEVLRILKNAVAARNVMVHRGQGELRPDFIAEVLGAVADVLWMCDYFTGQKWASRNLSEQTRGALGMLETADPDEAASDAPSQVSENGGQAQA